MRLPRPHPFFPPHQVASSAMSSSRYLSTPPARRTAATPNHHPPSPPTTSALRRATPAETPRPPHRENTRAGKDRHLLPKRDSRALSGPFRCNRLIADTCVEHRPVVQRPHPGGSGGGTPAAATVPYPLHPYQWPASSSMSCPPPSRARFGCTSTPATPMAGHLHALQLGRAPASSEASSYTRAYASPCHDPPWIKFDQNR